MLTFAKRGTVPPGGLFFYSDPDNGVPLLQETTGFEALVPRVRAAYVAAGKPVPAELAALVEDYVCRHVPRGFCFGSSPFPSDNYLTPQQVKGTTERMATTNRGRVDMGTVKSRMAICGMCKLNSKILCLSCTGLTRWAVSWAGRTHIGQDDSLGVCVPEGCLLSLLVSLDIPKTDADRPAGCWRHE